MRLVFRVPVFGNVGIFWNSDHQLGGLRTRIDSQNHDLRGAIAELWDDFLPLQILERDVQRMTATAPWRRLILAPCPPSRQSANHARGGKDSCGPFSNLFHSFLPFCRRPSLQSSAASAAERSTISSKLTLVGSQPDGIDEEGRHLCTVLRGDEAHLNTSPQERRHVESHALV